MTMKQKRKLTNLFLYIFLIACAGVFLVPLLIMVLGSFKNSIEVTAFSLSLPEKWLFGNYVQVFNKDFIRAVVNSLMITGVSVIINIALASMASFIIVRRTGKFSSFLYYFFFMGSLIPQQVIPTIKMLKTMHFYGTIPSAILMYIVINLPFACFLYAGFIKGVSRTTDEAAIIDGAGCFQVYYKIVLPLLKPINITVLIITFMNIWNDINIPLYFLSNPKYWTVPLTVYGYFGKYNGSNWELVFASLVLIALPIVIVYLMGQKYIVSGLTSGAVKQ